MENEEQKNQKIDELVDRIANQSPLPPLQNNTTEELPPLEGPLGAVQSEYKVYDYIDWSELLDKYKKKDYEDLKAFWGEIQMHKYDCLSHYNPENPPDPKLHEIIFNEMELPIIKKLFPETQFKKTIADWVKELYKKTKEAKKDKLQKYMDLRKSGVSYKDAKRLAQQAIKFTSYDELIKRYGRPFKVTYEFNSKDADLLFAYGLDDYCKMFWEKFYQPIETPKTRLLKK